MRRMQQNVDPVAVAVAQGKGTAASVERTALGSWARAGASFLLSLSPLGRDSVSRN
jgi:hypothetical protein